MAKSFLMPTPSCTLPCPVTTIHSRSLWGGSGIQTRLGLCQRASNAKKVSPELRDFLVGAVGLAAIGTIADVVPLIDENRVLVKHGLKTLLSHGGVGFRALLKAAKLNAKNALEAEDIAFSVAPRLNAAGRLGQAQLAVELLTTQDEGRAEALATYIDKLNGDRDSLERSIQLGRTNKSKSITMSIFTAFVWLRQAGIQESSA